MVEFVYTLRDFLAQPEALNLKLKKDKSSCHC